jgi:hypothetical protein
MLFTFNSIHSGNDVDTNSLHETRGFFIQENTEIGAEARPGKTRRPRENGPEESMEMTQSNLATAARRRAVCSLSRFCHERRFT